MQEIMIIQEIMQEIRIIQEISHPVLDVPGYIVASILDV